MRWQLVLQRVLSITLVALLAASVLSGCFGGDVQKITVLAGSELRDIEPLLDQIKADTGIELDLQYTGTLDGAEKLINGAQVDMAWFSHAKYLTLLDAVNSRVRGQEKIMLSPVVMGVKESKARAWGWLDNPNVTWKDIADKAAAGELHYAMTNPAASNSGFTALVGVASALAGTGDALRVEDINTEALRRFFSGQALTAGSSGWLADAYVADQDRLDGMINYESVLLNLNQGNTLHEKLYLVYPKEGIITADYPLLLINPDKREQYDKLVAYLRSPKMQQKLMETTLRRPVDPQIKLSSVFPQQLLLELPFPDNAAVIDQLLYGYLDEQRIPAHTVYVLDVSGSMEGSRINDLKAALTGLTGVDQSLTGQFARFRNRERVTMLPFSSEVYGQTDFDVDNTSQQSPAMDAIRSYVADLTTGGGTAIYSALASAYQQVEQAYAQDPKRYYSIVLMSDGEYNNGITPDEFAAFYHGLPPELQQVPVFTILFGGANEEEMQSIANLTGGRMFDAQAEPLSTIFKQIRGYQ
ncbi:MAG: VWA domain-containing protein [Caldilineaceae bacterium]